MCEPSYESLLEQARAQLGSHDSHDALVEANAAVNAALALRLDAAEAWLIKSQVLSSLHDDPAALAAAEQACRLAPQDAESAFVRAAVLSDMGLYERGLEQLASAFELITDPGHWLLEDLFYEKAAVLDALGRSEAAIAAFEEGLKRCPDSPLLKAGLEPLRRERLRGTLRVIDGGGQRSR